MSWLLQAKRQFEKLQRPLAAKDLEIRLAMSVDVAYKTISQLRKLNCIRAVSGSRRHGIYYEWIAGANLPIDRRGLHENCRKALHTHASRSHQQKIGSL